MRRVLLEPGPGREACDQPGRRARSGGWQVQPEAIACTPDGSLWLETGNGAAHWVP
ncbi:MAG TPA: hypothetical protein PKO09_17135 [Anaerolineae bacterium]|nr:hypothetical protein [Anaerolineae bacterium]